jgi:hypothetical protein
MIRNNLQVCLALPTASLLALILPACSINVQKEPNGDDKKVDIRTPIGGIHVSNEATASDIGLPVYPGAQLKVVALQYESDAAPSKVVAFYDDQLKKFGNVLVCHTNHFDFNANVKDHDNGSHELTCEGSAGANIELKVGTKENQHIVAVEPEGKGSTFSLVYVRTHGKNEEI